MLPVCDAPHPDLTPPRRPDKLNQRSGCCALALRVNTNLTSSPHTSSARHLYLSTIPFGLSTLKNKPTSANRRPNATQNVSQRVGPNSLWTSHSCVRPRRTTNARIRPPTASSPRMMGTPLTSLLLMAHHGGSGRSSPRPKNLPWIFFVHS